MLIHEQACTLGDSPILSESQNGLTGLPQLLPNKKRKQKKQKALHLPVLVNHQKSNLRKRGGVGALAKQVVTQMLEQVALVAQLETHTRALLLAVVTTEP
jgi:hypothetical protein